MADITSGSKVEEQRLARIERLVEAAARLELKNERAYAAGMRRLVRELDGEDRGAWLRRAYRTPQLPFDTPAERNKQPLPFNAARAFHGGGKAYTRAKLIKTKSGPSKRAGSAADHHRYIHSHGSGASHSRYVDRAERDGPSDRAVSNISDSLVERMRFFELVEAMEREAKGNAVTIDFNRVTPRKLAALHAIPDQPALQQAIADHMANGSKKKRRIRIDGTVAELRQALRANGAILLSKTSKGKRTFNEDCLRIDGISFHEERAGRTHFRWVFELPREFDAKQRRRTLEKLGAYMESEKFMYSAVIHQPDPQNDERNYHIHLIWYDRPCRKLDGSVTDLHWVPEHLKETVEEERDQGLFLQGEWDFAMERHYRSGRNWKTHYPFGAPKSRDGLLKSRDYKKELRAVYANLVNGIASENQPVKIYDPRSYKDRRMPERPPTKNLGSTLHAAELCGFVTETGSENEKTQSDYERKLIHEQWSADITTLRSWQRELNEMSSASDGPATQRASADLRRRLAEASYAAELQKLTGLLALELARERSRAERTEARQRRASMRGSKAERAMRLALADRAADHLLALARDNTEIRRELADARQELAACRPLSRALFKVLLGGIEQARRAKVVRTSATRQSPTSLATAAKPTMPRPIAAPTASSPTAAIPAVARDRREAVAHMVHHLLASPAMLRRSAGTSPQEVRFELTEGADQITRAKFKEVADDPLLHRVLASNLPHLSQPTDDKVFGELAPGAATRLVGHTEDCQISPATKTAVSRGPDSQSLLRLLKSARPSTDSTPSIEAFRQLLPTPEELVRIDRTIRGTLQSVSLGDIVFDEAKGMFRRPDGKELSSDERATLRVYRQKAVRLDANRRNAAERSLARAKAVTARQQAAPVPAAVIDQQLEQWKASQRGGGGIA